MIILSGRDYLVNGFARLQASSMKASPQNSFLIHNVPLQKAVLSNFEGGGYSPEQGIWVCSVIKPTEFSTFILVGVCCQKWGLAEQTTMLLAELNIDPDEAS